MVVDKTNRQLASDTGGVAEIVSRHLGGWERGGWVEPLRGQALDRAAPATRRAEA